MSREQNQPTFANDTDGQQIPSIETTPGTIPQTPLPGKAPSRPQANRPHEGRPQDGRDDGE
ncbi:hypothetical protein [Azospirillum sp. TSO22-1]|uniref:hypothetical protein n=1 Tax=Azospirillum sp. TSO22-1 TaxID=716789 RepID=UPI000D620FB0|nr:hypothetical protein [Azospirillum sp. TSO22-1]PWC38927.1 hypothetical protein TSO221_26065 [Azospirillum sp. TSO22-1]